MRSASDSKLGVAEWDAGVPGPEKSGDGDGDGLVSGVRSEELRDEKSMTSPLSRTRSGRRPPLQTPSLTGVEEALRCMAFSTGFLAPRFLSPSTVMMGSMGGLEAAGEQYNRSGGQSQLTWMLLCYRGSPLAFVLDLSPSGLRVGGLFWTSFHQPGSPNSCAPERKKVGLPTDRQPATVLHHVDVFFLRNAVQTIMFLLQNTS
ncbi:hypothetical protein XENOCAPTIV_022801 [Xenoophorus captivus]|uniref:Uncharacterized protein n=1 Tax=Xenoophorus captivus TaxID=1517983 RepID=A0ABV0QT70_9TELE